MAPPATSAVAHSLQSDDGQASIGCVFCLLPNDGIDQGLGVGVASLLYLHFLTITYLLKGHQIFEPGACTAPKPPKPRKLSTGGFYGW